MTQAKTTKPASRKRAEPKIENRRDRDNMRPGAFIPAEDFVTYNKFFTKRYGLWQLIITGLAACAAAVTVLFTINVLTFAFGA